MVKLKATLTRKVGPFTVGVWLVILVAGVGIGLLIRKRLGTGSAGEDSSGFVTEGAGNRGFPLEGGVNTPGAVVTGFAPRTVTIETPTVDVDRTVTQVGMVELPRVVKTAVQVPVRLPAPAPVKTVSKPPPTVSAPKAQTYTVVRGDSLRKIAQRFYGNADRWPVIYNANRAIIGGNPDLIRPGQRLVIPPL